MKNPLGELMRTVHEPVYLHRLSVLVGAIVKHLQAQDSVLDVGCGFGKLGQSLLESPQAPKGLCVQGVETVRRPGELIPVDQYDGYTLPYPDGRFAVVILADVLHHDLDPVRLILECKRVSRRLLIIKDHQIQGPFAQQRVSLIDWAANTIYGVPCLYRYNTPAQWAEQHRRLGFRIIEEQSSMDLYPWGYNLLFGRRLQYFAVLSTI
jgi:SAM-dependent methyltransferase